MLTTDHRTTTGTIRLYELLQQAIARARRLGKPILASLSEPAGDGELDPLAFYARAERLFSERALWLEPASGFALVGAGAALVIEPACGADRFQVVDRRWRELLSQALIEGPSDRAVGPRLLGGFSFDPEHATEPHWNGYSTARMLLPGIMLTASAGQRWLTRSVMVGPTDDAAELARTMEHDREMLFDEAPHVSSDWAVPFRPSEPMTIYSDRDHYERIVAAGSAAVRRGELEKVVLARQALVDARQPIDVAAALERLAESYPTCTIFAIGSGPRTFLGATPERLVELRDGVVRLDCLAGTQPRGETPEEDDRLARELLASTKNRWEHAVVLEAIRCALDGLCDEVDFPAEPGLRTVRNVHHLHTPVTARPGAGVSLLDLAGALHPTPAVGGTPRDAALAYIREHEGWDRGWYAGPIGWVDAGGDGQFAVALRSALIDGTTARLFAGCGIVGESDPESEFLESAAKLRPMLGALGIDETPVGKASETRR